MSEDVRALLAATAADVCEVARAPFCALSSLHGDDAFIAAVQGARSHGAPHPGTIWRVSDVPPARQAVVTSRAVTLADPDDPRLTAERISAGVAALDPGGPERGLTVSVGVATLPHDAALMEELVDKADWAMYLAKRQGRDRVMPFGPGAHEQTSGAPATK